MGGLAVLVVNNQKSHFESKNLQRTYNLLATGLRIHPFPDYGHRI